MASTTLYHGTAGISYGIPSAETGGLIQNLKVHAGSNKLEVKDNAGKIVGRVDSEFKIEVSYDLVKTAGTCAAAASPGVTLVLTNTTGTGTMITDDTDLDYSNTDVVKFSVKATIYPDIT